MAQLSDDCFAFAGSLLPLAEAERIIAEKVTPVSEREHVPLHSASGRVLANDISAPIDLPPFDNSAVDGYAVRYADLARDSDTRLHIGGRAIGRHRAQHAPAPRARGRVCTRHAAR